MTDVEFAILIFGLLFASFILSFFIFMIIFKWHKKKMKKLNEIEFNEKLSQNKNNYEAEKKLQDKKEN